MKATALHIYCDTLVSKHPYVNNHKMVEICLCKLHMLNYTYILIVTVIIRNNDIGQRVVHVIFNILVADFIVMRLYSQEIMTVD